jgi:hypothetical protein
MRFHLLYVLELYLIDLGGLELKTCWNDYVGATKESPSGFLEKMDGRIEYLQLFERA